MLRSSFAFALCLLAGCASTPRNLSSYRATFTVTVEPQADSISLQDSSAEYLYRSDNSVKNHPSIRLQQLPGRTLLWGQLPEGTYVLNVGKGPAASARFRLDSKGYLNEGELTQTSGVNKFNIHKAAEGE